VPPASAPAIVRGQLTPQAGAASPPGT
jgi:hypothetical protein